ncbi:Ig-like domain-containing protein, partial [Salmonella enterica subsp. enterica serovar Kentucky]|nr:Ig-like domain-containing protein [Salmonella enterica subsp. enterica serovar Kentucky]
FSLDNVDKAATRPVLLPGQRQAVRCVPVPLTLTTQPFNIREKAAGVWEYIWPDDVTDGSHTVTVEAIDEAGNKATQTLDFTID